MKKTVLITGASSGIGLELSRVFAREGFSVVMTARDRTKLARAVSSVRKGSSAEIFSIAADLSAAGSAEKLYRAVNKKRLVVDILVNNAGFGYTGPFLESDLRTDRSMIELNVTSLTILCKLFGRDMKKRGGGKILNVASVGSFMPGPFIAEYYATKAYVLSFTRALSRELDGTGVLVSALCPGSTRTNFAERAGKRDSRGAMSAERVALAAYRGLTANKRIIIPGFFNRIGLMLLKFIPASIIARIVGRVQLRLHDDIARTD
jgi:short-subunit dehydrogenase